VSAFVNGVLPFECVGVPLGVPVGEVEQWSLVQAYGLDGGGGGGIMRVGRGSSNSPLTGPELGNRGFFTMRHAVMDVSAHFEQIFSKLDRRTIASFVQPHVDRLKFTRPRLKPLT
jgi:hypothetical protein